MNLVYSSTHDVQLDEGTGFFCQAVTARR